MEKFVDFTISSNMYILILRTRAEIRCKIGSLIDLFLFLIFFKRTKINSIPHNSVCSFCKTLTRSSNYVSTWQTATFTAIKNK